MTPFWRRFQKMPDLHFHRRRGLNTYQLVWGEGHHLTQCADPWICERMTWADFVKMALAETQEVR